MLKNVTKSPLYMKNSEKSLLFRKSPPQHPPQPFFKPLEGVENPQILSRSCMLDMHQVVVL